MWGEGSWCVERPQVWPKWLQISKCGSKNSKTCGIIITDNSFSSNLTKRSFSTHSFEDLYCKSENVVYAIECTLCGLIYVGETKGELRKRMNGHRSQINNGGNQLLYRHFNLPDHSTLSMKVKLEFSRRYIIPQTSLLIHVPPFVGSERNTGFDNWELLLHMVATTISIA